MFYSLFCVSPGLFLANFEGVPESSGEGQEEGRRPRDNETARRSPGPEGPYKALEGPIRPLGALRALMA
jgi:hypothetical protein